MSNKELLNDGSVKDFLSKAGLSNETEMLTMLNDFMGVDASYADVADGLSKVKAVLASQGIN